MIIIPFDQPPFWGIFTKKTKDIDGSRHLPALKYLGVSENSVPLNPMVLLIIIPMKNGYFIGNMYTLFSDKPIWLKILHHGFRPICWMDFSPSSRHAVSRVSHLAKAWTSRRGFRSVFFMWTPHFYCTLNQVYHIHYNPSSSTTLCSYLCRCTWIYGKMFFFHVRLKTEIIPMGDEGPMWHFKPHFFAIGGFRIHHWGNSTIGDWSTISCSSTNYSYL